ncbi:MAG TPA: hypothetical protein VHN80_28280 [Kineosporiaceae bacterium]|nr:hypothetical protein [Kineosporiaceae bacterium]
MLLTDGPAAGLLLDVEPGPRGMPNLIEVPMPRPGKGAAGECAKERYARMWCPTPRSGQPVQYHYLAPSPGTGTSPG